MTLLVSKIGGQVQGDEESACKLESKTQSRAFNQARQHSGSHRLNLPRPNQTFNLNSIMNLVAFLPPCMPPQPRPCMSAHGPATGSTYACNANSPPSTPQAPREYAGDPRRRCGLLGGGIQGVRFGRPGHFTKRGSRVHGNRSRGPRAPRK